MAKEGLRHSLELPDAAGFCLRAPFAQESPSLAPVFLLPEFCELLLEQVGTLQRLVESETSFQRLAASFVMRPAFRAHAPQAFGQDCAA